MLAVLMAAPLAAQDAKKKPVQAHPKVDQAKVDAAIRKGIAYLKTRMGGLPQGHDPEMRSDELVLWTFVHAGVPETDPDFQKLFKSMMERNLQRTYTVSLQAMILEELDRVKYQGRLWQCAQFLVDNQCATGQWSYGEPTVFDKGVPTGGQGKKDVATSGEGQGKPQGQRTKPRVVRKIPVTRRRGGPAAGDNSNSQYAALGLRACHDAGILLPEETIKSAQEWWRAALCGAEKQEAYPAQGWCYGGKGDQNAYGSMTVGAVGAMCIYDYVQDEKSSWMKDPTVRAGLNWLARHFSVTENPKIADSVPALKGYPQMYYYYYLYGLERVGVLYGTETMGAHEWYPEGAQELFKAQGAGGSWASRDGGNEVWDTCFAILFLRRATRPLTDVASEDTRRSNK